MTLECGARRTLLSFEGRVFMHGISALMQEALSPLLLCGDTARRQLSRNRKWVLSRHWICHCLHPGLFSLKHCDKFLLFISQPVCGIAYDSSPKRLKYKYYSKSISCHRKHDFGLCPSEKGPHEVSPIKTSKQSSASGEPGLPGSGSYLLFLELSLVDSV